MASARSGSSGRRVVVAAALALAAVAVLVIVTVPRGDPERSVVNEVPADADVHVAVFIEDVAAANGSMKVRVVAAPAAGSRADEDFTVLTDVEGLAPIHLQADAITPAESAADVLFASGSVGAYPFDHYHVTFHLLVVKGAPKTSAEINAAVEVPTAVSVLDSTSGFDIGATVDPSRDAPQLASLLQAKFDVVRSRPSVVWACVMMAIYWLLAVAILAVTFVVIRRYREWETRLLAWLAAMLFAFASFRNAAPGQPPIGVYFDYVSFFWAEMTVALCLAALVVFYLVGLDAAPTAGVASDDDDSTGSDEARTPDVSA
jgi:hypothetical protein